MSGAPAGPASIGRCRHHPDHVDVAGVGSDAGTLRSIRLRDLGVRFGFGAAVSVAAAVVADVAGARVGGALLAFPAILPAALTLIESREGTSTAVSDVRGAAVGAIGMVGFALSVALLAGRIPVPLALVTATAAWAGLSAALYFGGIRLAATLGEQQYLPDVGVVEAVPAVGALRRAGLTVAVAESCTGGALSALLTAADGAGGVVRGGVVVAPGGLTGGLLDVAAELRDRDGVGREATARAMADAVRHLLDADVGLAVTELARPPSGERAVLFVAAAGPRGPRATRVEGDRGLEADRGRAIRDALRLCTEVVGH